MLNKILIASCFIATSSITQAGIVIGGSDLLTSSYHTQLENWLGKGSLNLTNIFDKKAGDSYVDFHAAADGKGATFTLMEIINGNDVMIIGGYNQDSWFTGKTFLTNENYNHVDYTLSKSFLFNLNTGLKYDRARYTYDTYHRASYGPTFGGGHDLYINSNLTGGYANIGHSYGDTSRFTHNDYRVEFTGSYNAWSVGALEVFTTSEGSQPIPEPTPLLLMGLGVIGLTLVRKKKVTLRRFSTLKCSV